MLMIMGKDNAIKLPKALKKLNLAPTSFKVWEKVRLEFLPVPSTGVLPSRGDHGIRKGFFAVYVGKEAKRYVIPLSYLKHPVFLQLLKKAEEEFGFGGGGGGLQIPCDTEVFDRVLLFVGREHDPSHDGKMEELLKLFMQPRRAC